MSGSFIAAVLGGFVSTFAFIAVLSIISVAIALFIKAPGQRAVLKKERRNEKIHAA